MALTKGEMVKVAGKFVVGIGEAMDDPATPDKITAAEARALVEKLIADLLAEYTD